MEINNASASSSQPGQPAQSFKFITFDDPEAVKSASNRQLVRSHAMRHYHGQSSPPARRRRNEIELDISPLLQRSARPGLVQQDKAAQIQPDLADSSPSNITYLDATRLDPLFQYPIEMSVRQRELCDHLYDEACTMFRTMRDVGFLNRVRQTAAFRQLLAMSSWHIAHQVGDHRMTEHLTYSLSATQELQAKINNPRDCTTDDAIAAVLAFACYANLIHDSALLDVHINGLKLMLDQRGGMQTLDLNPLLRIMLYWVDINGSFFQDKAPTFPPPEHLLPKHSHQIQCPLGTTEESVREVISRFCLALKDVQAEILQQMRQRPIWKDLIFPGYHISPILGNLLTLRPIEDSFHSATRTLEAFRLGAILYTSNLRACFGIDVVAGARIYSDKLRALLFISSHGMDSGAVIDPGLSIWILAVAFSSKCLPIEDRDAFRGALEATLTEARIANTDSLMVVLSQFVWSEEIFHFETQIVKSLFVR